MEKNTPQTDVITVENYLKKSNLQLTVNDASASTGLPVSQAKDAIDVLREKYVSKLKLTENGDLIYDFGTSLLRKGKKTFKEYLTQFGNWLWKAFKAVYRVWIAATLVVYFILFIIILIGITIAMLSSDSDDGDTGFDLGGLIGGTFRSIFIWHMLTPVTYYETDEYGYRYKRYDYSGGKLDKKGRKKKKGFVASVYDFVFGPKRVENDPLENEKEVATYLKNNKGLIVTSEMKGLAGLESDKADTFFSDCLLRYNAEAKISDNGVLYGDYKEFIRRADNKQGSPVVWYWDEYDAPHELTGNTGWMNTKIIGMNLFNLGFSGFLLYLMASTNILELFPGIWAPLFLGFIPIIFSSIFFLTPLLRSLRLRSKNKKRHKENIKKRLMKVIYDQHSEEIKLNSLIETTNAKSKGEEQLSKETVQKIMEDLVFDLGGETYVNEQAEVVYKFHQLNNELNEIKRLREETEDDTNLGKVIMDV